MISGGIRGEWLRREKEERNENLLEPFEEKLEREILAINKTVMQFLCKCAIDDFLEELFHSLRHQMLHACIFRIVSGKFMADYDEM